MGKTRKDRRDWFDRCDEGTKQRGRRFQDDTRDWKQFENSSAEEILEKFEQEDFIDED
jgi:hypothetical protein